jgi:hypothetical protein
MFGNTTAIGWLNDAEVTLHRMRTFHRDRVETIRKDESHVRLTDAARLILHLIPEEAVRAPKSFSAIDLKRASQSFRVLGDRDGYNYRNSRFNADGFLLFDGSDASRCYSQLYRNGVYEGVMAGAVYKHREQASILRENSCEEAMLSAVGGYLAFAKAVSVEPPLWLFSALVGCEGARLYVNRSWEELSEHSSIDRNLIWFPEVKIEALDIEPAKHLRPLLDVLWNAVGLERSYSYDEEGNRKPRR